MGGLGVGWDWELGGRLKREEIYVCECSVASVIYDSLQPFGLQPTRLLSPWDSPGKNTGVGCHTLLQETFPTQELNWGLLSIRQILHQLSYQGSHFFTIITCKKLLVLLLLLSYFRMSDSL